MKKGKFIVIDGIDGSGKATQTEMLVKRLQKNGLKVKKIDFPGYERNFYGKLIGECLTGKYGDFIAVHPRIASVLYAADRWESSKQINDWLDRGYTVIADRYVSSNQIHQGRKIKDISEREEFLKWLDTAEHEIFGIPRPTMILFLHLPVKLSMALMEKRKKQDAVGSRKYLEGKKDLAEEDFKHLEESRNSAIGIVKSRNNWHMIDCEKDDDILPREDIHERLFQVVAKKLRLKANKK